MTKYNIKLRRSSLTHGQIERHKNFQGLYSSVKEEKPSFPWLRMLVLILGVLMVLTMLGMGVHLLLENRKEIERYKSNTEFLDDI